MRACMGESGVCCQLEESQLGKRCSEERALCWVEAWTLGCFPRDPLCDLGPGNPFSGLHLFICRRREVELVRSFFIVRFHPCCFLHLPLS